MMLAVLFVVAPRVEVQSQYANVQVANTSDSLAILQQLPLKYFSSKFDSVPGRRHFGLTGPDVESVLPTSVTFLPTKTLPNPLDHRNPLVVKDYYMIDHHQLIESDIREDLVANEERDNEQNKLIETLEKYLQQEASIQLIEKRRTAEAEAEKIRLQTGLVAAEASERRKTNQAHHQHELDLADYQEKLETDRIIKADELGRQRNLELVKLQEESAKRAEFMRRETEENLKTREMNANKENAELDRQAKLAQIAAEADGRRLQERENEDIAMRKLLAQAEQDRLKLREAIELSFAGIGRGLLDLITDRQKLTITLGSLVALAAGIFAVREAAKLIASQIAKRLGRPTLIRETSRRSGWQAISSVLSSAILCGSKARNLFGDVILPLEMKSRVEALGRSISNARRHRAPFRHLMLYGPPGTGKTMVAKRLARGSGLDYAIMSGGDVGPLGSDAVTQLHALFLWANASPNGLLLFIDEAEAFLGSRSRQNMSETQRNALNALLYQTGEQSYKFMMVLATNRPEDLDTAVTDRVDENLCFHIPASDARISMLKMYYEKHVLRNSQTSWLQLWGNSKRIKATGIDEKMMARVAQKTEGFSGREIAKLMISVQGAAYGSIDGVLTSQMFEQVVDWKVAEHRDKKTKYESKGF